MSKDIIFSALAPLRSATRDLLTLAPLQLVAAALLALAGDAAAQEPLGARELAQEALQLEFVRAGVTAPEDELAQRFAEACERGYRPACERRNWVVDGLADLQRASHVFAKPCDEGDPLACLVRAWALDQAAPGSTDPDRTWRSAAVLLKTHCDAGFQPACFEYGVYLFENKGFQADPRAAYPRWRAACQAGEQQSCTKLGALQIDGAPGMPRSAGQALSALDRACSAGHAEACHLAGRQRESGWAPDKVVSWFGDLCDRGHRASCWHLGLRYRNGTLPASGADEIDAVMRRGCALRHPNACYDVARATVVGEAPDWQEAAALFGTACRHGDDAGCKELVTLQLDGRVQGSLKSDAFAYDRACEGDGHLPACTHLALGLINGVDLPRDPSRARTLLQRTCTGPESAPEACVALARVFEEGIGGPRDRTESAGFYRWACYAGRYDACDRRGDLLATGSGIKRDDHEALAMFERACSGGVAQACRKGGTILDEATYVQRNLSRAAELYALGCEGGVAAACAALGRVREEGIGGVPDFDAAREAYERGIAMDDVESHRRMARLLWNGLGGKREKGRARQLTREACQSGDPVACRGPEFL